MSNIIIKIQFPNRLSRTFTFSEAEFKSYLSHDNKTLQRFKTAQNLPEITPLNMVYESFCENLIDNFNSYSSSALYKLKLIKFTTSHIATDSTINRLDLALYYADNHTITAMIAENLKEDTSIKSPIILSSVSDIERIRSEKMQYIANIRNEVINNGNS